MYQDSVEHLYGLHSEAYAALSRDRDFLAECRAVASVHGGLLQSSAGIDQHRVLELFAGPAEHGRVWGRSFNADVWGIDASPEMRDVAVKDGNAEACRYVVSQLPALGPLGDMNGYFDVVTAMRYSIGYLDRSDVVELMKSLVRLLRPGGVFFVELHRLDWMRNDLRDMDIRDRATENDSNESTRLEWPSGQIRWSNDDWLVDMPLVLSVAGQEHVMVSREQIYSVSEFAFLVETFTSMSQIHIPDTCVQTFPMSRPVAFRRLP